MNITGAVTGNPRFHHIKTVLCLTDFNTLFQRTIVRSYRATMFALHVDTFLELALCSYPDFARSKTPWSLLKFVYLWSPSASNRSDRDVLNASLNQYFTLFGGYFRKLVVGAA